MEWLWHGRALHTGAPTSAAGSAAWEVGGPKTYTRGSRETVHAATRSTKENLMERRACSSEKATPLFGATLVIVG